MPQELRFDEDILAYDYLRKAREDLSELKMLIEKAYESESYDYEIDIFNKYEDLGGYDFEVDLEKGYTQFGFSCEMLNRPVSTLSGGEKTKLAILKIMLNKPDLLLLDEPTNHLEVNSREIVERAIEKYEGTILFVSHDRMFLNKLADSFYDLESNLFYSNSFALFKNDEVAS